MSKITEQIRNFLKFGPNEYPEIARKPVFNEEYFGHRIALMDKGEIRFGPPYFDLFIDNAVLANKSFGMNIWFLDDYLFAAEEWLTTSEQYGPLTRLVLFNIQHMKCSALSQINGFAEHVRIESSKLIYTRREKNWTKEVEVAIDEITNWAPIFGSRWSQK